MWSLYSHVTFGRIFPVKQCLKSCPLQRDTSLDEKHIELIGKSAEKSKNESHNFACSRLITHPYLG